ncbi:hypothetical protein RclHR1_09140005 [Rhizophagus clarus]|uniref:Uncharacterized protein n=1 Tax=Rhizophagus clarus TaxID=94130 RepID=A0A2Z6SDU1_9GLOM|nr:hypothetical protein RclHR1_09140005 [Rhizophagus clarus]GES85031.1 hypothetical protein GLOIN_2v1557793 [Rhizophagus clarus]
MVVHAVVIRQSIPIVLTCLQFFVKKFKGFRTSATVTINNKHREMKLTNPEIFSPGEIDNPLEPTINPGETPHSSRFYTRLGKFTSRGMISYNVFGQVGENERPLYLIVTWKVKFNGDNSLGIGVYEYEDPPLKNKSVIEKYDIYKDLLKRNADCKAWPTYDNGAFFSVGGTIDTRRDANIIITFDHNYRNPV